MKSIIRFMFSIMIATAMLASCSKDDAGNGGAAKFEYKVNGQLVTYNPDNALSGEIAYAAKQLWPVARYVVNAQKGSNDVFNSVIVSDSLTTGTYRTDSVLVASGNAAISLNRAGVLSMVYFATDYIEFNITEHRGGRLSATFAGRLSPTTGGLNYSTRGTVYITEGKIENLKVIY